MLERSLRYWPAGVMWSVVIRSPTLSVTCPSTCPGGGSACGGAPMFGPRSISTLGLGPSGKMNMLSSIWNAPGIATAGGAASSVRGSVNSPRIAATAATWGLTR